VGKSFNTIMTSLESLPELHFVGGEFNAKGLDCLQFLPKLEFCGFHVNLVGTGYVGCLN
jgi:hypothetical protein